MTCYVSSGTLNPTPLWFKLLIFLATVIQLIKYFIYSYG